MILPTPHLLFYFVWHGSAPLHTCAHFSIYAAQTPSASRPPLPHQAPRSPQLSLSPPLQPQLHTRTATGWICGDSLLNGPTSFRPTLITLQNLPFKKRHTLLPFPGSPLQPLDTGGYFHGRQWPQGARRPWEELSFWSQRSETMLSRSRLSQFSQMQTVIKSISTGSYKQEDTVYVSSVIPSLPHTRCSINAGWLPPNPNPEGFRVQSRGNSLNLKFFILLWC